MCMNYACHNRNAFTLIEMLVVVAIIGILAALMMPGLQKALNMAHSVTCSNNLRAIAMANINYTEDHNDEFCDFRSGGGAGVVVWREYLAPYVGNIDLSWCYNNCGVWHCPSQPYINSNWQNSASYGGNFSLRGKKLSQVHSPSSIMVAVDTNLRGGNHTWPINWGSSYTWIDWRHNNNSSNMVFVDQHVEPYHFSECTESDFDYKQWH